MSSPPSESVQVGVGAPGLNVAVTVLLPFMVTLHVPVPEHPDPDQPAKVEPEAAVAVRLTTVLE
jgi:hypothetical protein